MLDDSASESPAKRRICGLCGRWFLFVMPPGEEETERAEWEGKLRSMWGSAFAERYESMHLALDRIEDVDKAAAARVDDAARRSPRIASILADIGAKLAQDAK